MQIKLTHHQDQAHGWIEAPLALVKLSGVLEKISGYSYQSLDGQTLYLEEDQDAGLFLEALGAAGIKPEMKSKAVKYSKIRNLPAFTRRVEKPENPILKEALIAFQDCHNETVPGERNLDFKASASVDGATLREIVKRAVPGGYNDFNESVLEKVFGVFGEESQYTIAREGSPAIYVRPFGRVWINRTENLSHLADEVSYEEDGSIRLWWD